MELGAEFENFKILNECIEYNGNILRIVTTKIFSHTREENGLLFSTLKDADEYGNPRMQIPIEILRITNTIRPDLDWLNPKKAKPKKPHSWFICWFYQIRPVTGLIGWRRFECSHRCTTSMCITPECLVWESRADNLSRGYHICTQKCYHCGDMICICTQIHVPSCLPSHPLENFNSHTYL